MSTSSQNPPLAEHSTIDVEKHTTTESIRAGPAPQSEKPHLLERSRSRVSGHEIIADEPHPPEVGDEIFNKFSPHRKMVITTVLSLCGFLAPIASTTVLSAVPEVSRTFHTTGTIINVSQALYLVGMGLSPCFWGPLAQIYGRRWVSNKPPQCQAQNSLQIDLYCRECSFHGLFSCNGIVAEFGRLFHLSHPHRFSRHLLPHHGRCMHW